MRYLKYLTGTTTLLPVSSYTLSSALAGVVPELFFSVRVMVVVVTINLSFGGSLTALTETSM